MEESIHFSNDAGEKLVGTLHHPANPVAAGVIFGHCFTCSRHTSILRETARKLADQGIAALRFDFSGNGQSDGDFINTSYTRHIGEMQAAGRFFAAKGISRFGLAGHSMGATIAVLAAARMENVAGVCAFAGRLGGLAPDGVFTAGQLAALRNTGQLDFTSRGRRLSLSRAFFDDASRYDILKTIATLNPSLLVVHGDADEIIPVSNARTAESHNPRATVKIIAGADHMFSDPAVREKVALMTALWFRQCFDG